MINDDTIVLETVLDNLFELNNNLKFTQLTKNYFVTCYCTYMNTYNVYSKKKKKKYFKVSVANVMVISK